MCLAFEFHKERCYRLALEAVEKVQADDWRLAAQQWVEKRKKAWEAKEGSNG
jgi:hypothetical protein